MDKIVTLLAALAASHPTCFRTIDPNFSREGIQQFCGASLADALGEPRSDQVITVIAADRYVMRASAVDLIRDGGLLATAVGGQPIAKAVGGPMKLVFRQSRAREDHVWYVGAIVVGDFVGLPPPRLGDLLTTTMDVPIPRGIRHGMALPPARRLVTGRVLVGLKTKRGAEATRLMVHDLLGNDHSLNLKDPEGPILMIYELDHAPIPVALGGPYLVAKLANKGVDGRGINETVLFADRFSVEE